MGSNSELTLALVSCLCFFAPQDRDMDPIEALGFLFMLGSLELGRVSPPSILCVLLYVVAARADRALSSILPRATRRRT